MTEQPLYGQAEFAQALGIKPSTLRSYRSRKQLGLPEPAQRLDIGPVWTHEQVEAYKRKRGKK